MEKAVSEPNRKPQLPEKETLEETNWVELTGCHYLGALQIAGLSNFIPSRLNSTLAIVILELYN